MYLRPIGTCLEPLTHFNVVRPIAAEPIYGIPCSPLDTFVTDDMPAGGGGSGKAPPDIAEVNSWIETLLHGEKHVRLRAAMNLCDACDPRSVDPLLQP